MSKLHTPIVLTITTSQQLEELQTALMHAHDMNDDMLFDDLPYRPDDIKTLVGFNDEIISGKLKEMREATSSRITTVFAIRELQMDLDAAIDVFNKVEK